MTQQTKHLDQVTDIDRLEEAKAILDQQNTLPADAAMAIHGAITGLNRPERDDHHGKVLHILWAAAADAARGSTYATRSGTMFEMMKEVGQHHRATLMAVEDRLRTLENERFNHHQARRDRTANGHLERMLTVAMQAGQDEKPMVRVGRILSQLLHAATDMQQANEKLGATLRAEHQAIAAKRIESDMGEVTALLMQKAAQAEELKATQDMLAAVQSVAETRLHTLEAIAEMVKEHSGHARWEPCEDDGPHGPAVSTDPETAAELAQELASMTAGLVKLHQPEGDQPQALTQPSGRPAPAGWVDADAALDTATDLLMELGTEGQWRLAIDLTRALEHTGRMPDGMAKGLREQIGEARRRIADAVQVVAADAFQNGQRALLAVKADQVDADKEHPVFEAWAKGWDSSLVLQRSQHGGYIGALSNACWHAWMARAVLVPAPERLVEVRETETRDGGGHGGMHSGIAGSRT